MLFREPSQAGQRRIGMFCGADAAQNRFRNLGEVRQAGIKVAAQFQSTCRTDRSAEQATAASLRIDSETACKCNSSMRADRNTMMAATIAETHPQTAGNVYEQIIAAAGNRFAVSHCRYR